MIPTPCPSSALTTPPTEVSLLNYGITSEIATALLYIYSLDPIAEAARDFPILPPSLQQGYAAADEDILSRELRQAEFMLATRLDALIYQLHSAR